MLQCESVLTVYLIELTVTVLATNCYSVGLFYSSAKFLVFTTISVLFEYISEEPNCTLHITSISIGALHSVVICEMYY